MKPPFNHCSTHAAHRYSLTVVTCLLFTLLACSPTRPPEPSRGHLSEVLESPAKIPQAVSQTTLLPPPKVRPRMETYTVVVNEVPVKDLLFSMARDARINLDIHNDITGSVTLNAIDQTLQQLLERIAEQTAIRYKLEANTLRIRADKPYLRHYKIDYVNIARESKGVVRVATSIGSTGQGNIGTDQATSGGGANQNENNSSLTEVRLTSDNKFWQSLTHNIMQILGDEESSEDEATEPTSETESETGSETSSDEQTADSAEQSSSELNPNVIVNREAGLMIVRATHKQHKIIQKFIDQVLNSSKRQVMIEATIAEIKLSDRYQAGVDWTLVAADPASGFNILTDMRGANLAQPPFSSFTLNDDLSGDQVSATLRALEQFGDVQVLSSPRVMAINNQPAILKVVDNIVYFELTVDTSSTDATTRTTLETEIKTIPVGFVMSVTPFINDHEAVTLNIRPTISRVIDTVEDPNPEFKKEGVVSQVPVIQVREIESILTINSGDTAVIGGLMQDTVNDTSQGVPILSNIPIIGSLFRYQDDLREKSELIIFIRPRVIKHASLSGDLSDYKQFLPQHLKTPIKKSNNKPASTTHSTSE